MTRVVEPGATRDISEDNQLANGPRWVGFAECDQTAYWSSWADCLPMVHQRHPPVAATLVTHLSGIPEKRCLSAAWEAKHELAAWV